MATDHGHAQCYAVNCDGTIGYRVRCNLGNIDDALFSVGSTFFGRSLLHAAQTQELTQPPAESGTGTLGTGALGAGTWARGAGTGAFGAGIGALGVATGTCFFRVGTGTGA
jgi:hypothetical protein